MPSDGSTDRDRSGKEQEEDMVEYQINPSGVSPDTSRQRINELITNYSDEELGRMVRSAMAARQQAEREDGATLRSFRAWLESVGLGWIVAASDRTADALKSILEALRRIFA
jgi:hypothetical protein